MAANPSQSVTDLRAANAEMLSTQSAINVETMRAQTALAALQANRTLWEKIR